MYISYPIEFHISESKMHEIAKMLNGIYDVKIKKIKLSGHLYSYKNIFWAKVDTQKEGGYYFFFLNNNSIELSQFNY